MIKVFMGEENPVQCGGLQLGLAVETADQCPWSRIDIKVSFPHRQPHASGRPELLGHDESGTRCANEFDERHVLKKG
jgi:hypothetical protein